MSQLSTVLDVMRDGGRRTLREIAARIGNDTPEASISARLRDIRKMGYRVERTRVHFPEAPGVRVFAYRVKRGGTGGADRG